MWRRPKPTKGCTAVDEKIWQQNSQADKFTTGQMIQHNFDEIITVHIPVIQIHIIKYSVLLQIKQWYTLY